MAIKAILARRKQIYDSKPENQLHEHISACDQAIISLHEL
jgi:hypothetical protein